MDKICAISKCKISSLKNPHICFHPFPTDFNLCMLWVQKCGVPKFVEDFAYGGAQPFMNKHICSQHFRSNDLLDPSNPFAGIKLGIIPSASSKLIKIRDESVKKANVKHVKIKLSDIKQQDFNEIIVPPPNNVQREIPDEYVTNFKEESTSYKPDNDFLQNDEEESAYAEEFTFSNLSSDSFNSDSSDTGTNYDDFGVLTENSPTGVIDEVVRQRLKRDAERKALKRKMETPAETRVRLQREAQRAAFRRSHESEDQRQQRLRKNAYRAAMRRQNETPHQREARRQKDIIRSRERRMKESEIEARIRKYNDAVRAAFRRKEESEEQRNERRVKDVIRAAKRRKEESVEQRALRLKKDRERVARRRQLMKMRDKLLSMGVIFDELGQIVAESDLSLRPAMYDLLALTSNDNSEDNPIQNESSYYDDNNDDDDVSNNSLEPLSNTDFNIVSTTFSEPIVQEDHVGYFTLKSEIPAESFEN